jgi:hypothetical protein
MRHKIQESLLMALPLLMALAVGLGLPASQTADTAARRAPQADYDETLARACEASHRARATPATPGDAAARTQSPAWQQQHRAAVELCLRDGLRIMRTARAGA